MVEGKTCTKCGEFKVYSDYHKKKATKDGYRPTCKLCTNSQNTKYRKENPDKVKHSIENYRNANREKLRQKDAEYRERNLEDCRRRTREHARKNSEARKEYKRQYYLLNKDKINKKGQEYRKKFPDRNALKEQRRRARKEKLPSDLTIEQWNFAVGFFGGECCYCGDKPQTLHQEHFVPLFKKGGYTVSNIVPSCADCNFSKRTKDFSDWYFTKENHSLERATKIFEYFKVACKEAA